MSHCRSWCYPSLLLACVLYAAQLCSSFNIDTVYPLVYKDPVTGSQNNRESYFGYSVKFLFKQKDPLNSAKWLLVGAPRANSTFETHAGLREPGQVFRCLLKSGVSQEDICKPLIIDQYARERNKPYEENKDYGWLGATMDVLSPLDGSVAICGYRWKDQKLKEKGNYMNGVCYWSEHQISEADDFYKILPIVRPAVQVTNDGIYNYAYGQSGFSIHMTRKNDKIEEMIIGAPGVFNWKGAVIRISDYYLNTSSGIKSRRKRQDNTLDLYKFEEKFIPDVAKISQLEPSGYFGYSVSSGIFYEDGKLLYVSGAPRAADMRGKVSLFDFLSTSDLDIKLQLNGSQLGEYFGASVLAVDLTSDGKAELLVGAPQHSLQSDVYDRCGDEGKVYVYINRKGSLEMTEAFYGSKTKGARFGTTMASIGDINHDGFNDVVIGAPYENDKGAVYLYLGGRYDIKRHQQTAYWQRIAAADFVSPLDGLKGFGMSLAAADIDDNEYPDLAVGSFMSGHALVFRSKPIVQIKVIDGVSAEPINSIKGSIDYKIMLSFDTAPKSTRQSTIPEICVEFSLYFDAEFINTPRMELIIDNQIYNQQPYNFTRIISKDPSSQTFRIGVTNLPYYSQDFSRPAKFRLYSKLMKNVRPINDQCIPTNDSFVGSGSHPVFIGPTDGRNDVVLFCPTCPVLDQTEKNYVERSVSFTTECGSDNICTEDLEIEGQFSDNLRELVIGSKKTLSFTVKVTNHGEPSYVTTLDIQLPSHTYLKLTPTNACKSLSFSMSEEQIYSCQLPVNPLKNEQTTTMEFELDVVSLSSGINDLFSVIIEARMKGSAALGKMTRLNMTIPLSTAIDVEVLGNSVEEQLTYRRPNLTSNVTVEERVVVQHLFEVRNVLPSPLSQLDIETLIPVSLVKDENTMIDFLQLPLIVEITQKGLQNKTTCQVDRIFREPELKKYVQELGQSFQKQPDVKYAQANRTELIDCFNTKGVICLKYLCPAGPLTPETPITVHITGTLVLNDLLLFFGAKDVFIVSSVAHAIIQKPFNISQPANHKPDIAIASTHILPQGPPVAQGVASWIIVLSVLAGALLLSLMVVGLHKMGFFKRRRYPQDGLTGNENTPGDGNNEDMEVDVPTNEGRPQ